MKAQLNDMMVKPDGTIQCIAVIIACMHTDMTEGQLLEHDDLVFIDCQETSEELVNLCYKNSSNSVDIVVTENKIKYTFTDGSVIKLLIY